MDRRRIFATVFCFALTGLTDGLAADERYPTKPIRFVTTEPGTSIDVTARLIAYKATAISGQQMIVDNRGIVAPEIVARSQPDGYTLLLYTNPLWLLPLFRSNVPWDPIKDYLPVTLLGTCPNVVVVHPSVAAHTILELIALAKARPGELNYGSSSTGASNHVAAELFKAMAGVNIARINYKGAGASFNDVMAGQLQLMFATAPTVTAHIGAGRVRALAVTSAEPSPVVPGLPTVAASGLPGYESVSLSAMFAPLNTPEAIVNQVNREIVQILNDREVKERIFKAGVEAAGTSRGALTETIKAEMARMGKVIKEAGLRE